MIRARRLFLLLLIPAVALAPPASARSRTCEWVETFLPFGSPQTAALADVEAIAPDDVWAVGTYRDPGTDPDTMDDTFHALAAHWNGSSWTVLPAPGQELSGVAAVSPRLIWAVGRTVDGPLVARLMGKRWRAVRTPVDHDPTVWLRAVSAVGPDDAWAIGYRAISFDPYETEPVFLRWDGSGWAEVPSADPNPGATVLRDVAAVSATEAWAAGQTGGRVFVERWDGSSWSASRIGRRGWLSGVSGLGWAVGAAEVTRFGWKTLENRPLALRWDGQAWTGVRTAAIRDGERLIGEDVGGSSPSRVWLVGYYAPGGDIVDVQAFAERWDGERWRVVELPIFAVRQSWLLGVDSAAGATWAVGATNTSTEPPSGEPIALRPVCTPA